MKVEQYVVGPIQTNCYFIINQETKSLLIVDPGAAGKALAAKIREKGYRPVAVLLTHGHFDHVGGVAELREAFPRLSVYACEKEKETLQDPRVNLSATMDWNPVHYEADEYLKENEEVSLAGFTFRVLLTPGHTPGGCCFYFEKEHALFSGDSLFHGSIGRTDFPKGSFSQLVRSVQERLLVLPDETSVYPGHEDLTTIGEEKRYNPFLRESEMAFI